MATTYEIIDVHVHLCRDTAQERLVFPRKGWPDEWFWASPERAERYMDYQGISHLVSVNMMDHNRMTAQRLVRLPADVSDTRLEAARAELREEMCARVQAFNRWACDFGNARPRLIPFVMADPVLFGDALIDEVEACIELGARGLKVHPGICGHLPDHPSMLPVYDRCQELDLPILTDTGGDPDREVSPYGMPVNWVPVLKQFPRLRLIMAHFPGEYWDQRIAIAQEFRRDNLVFDTAGGFVDGQHPPRNHRELLGVHAARLFRQVGVDRILFGSDGPGIDPIDTARQVVGLDLTEEEKERILSKNARAFLHLES